MSITTVYLESQNEYNGQYHAHPYGEINCVVQIDPTAELSGMQGWRGAGWTSPGPGEFSLPLNHLLTRNIAGIRFRSRSLYSVLVH